MHKGSKLIPDIDCLQVTNAFEIFINEIVPAQGFCYTLLGALNDHGKHEVVELLDYFRLLFSFVDFSEKAEDCLLAEEELEELVFALIQKVDYDTNPSLKTIVPFLIAEVSPDDILDTHKQLVI